MIFFTSDTHFDHKNIIKYSERPFRDVAEMNDELIKRWNSVVSYKDTVYHLGDFVLSKKTTPERLTYYLNMLNGKIEFCYGNHDDIRLFNKAKIQGQDIRKVRYEGEIIILCHYAMRVWNRSHHGTWHLYGHSHGALPEADSLSFDVGVDANNYYPVSFDQVREKILAKKKKLELSGKSFIVGKKGKPLRK